MNKVNALYNLIVDIISHIETKDDLFIPQY